jgi:hypothetical protein
MLVGKEEGDSTSTDCRHRGRPLDVASVLHRWWLSALLPPCACVTCQAFKSSLHMYGWEAERISRCKYLFKTWKSGKVVNLVISLKKKKKVGEEIVVQEGCEQKERTQEGGWEGVMQQQGSGSDDHCQEANAGAKAPEEVEEASVSSDVFIPELESIFLSSVAKPVPLLFFLHFIWQRIDR